MARSRTRVTGPGNRPRWFRPLMELLDPDRDAWALIKDAEDRYSERRTGDDVGPQPSHERPRP